MSDSSRHVGIDLAVNGRTQAASPTDAIAEISYPASALMSRPNSVMSVSAEIEPGSTGRNSICSAAEPRLLRMMDYSVLSDIDMSIEQCGY